MKRIITILEYWLCSGHRFDLAAESGKEAKCSAIDLCLSCDGNINCHLAKQLAAAG